jgi:hypothetical protein
MTKDFFEHLLPEIDGYYERNDPDYTRAEWHDAWLRAEAIWVEWSEDVGCDVWFVREPSRDVGVKAKILAFSIRDELLSSDELARKTRWYGISEDNLQKLID